RDDTFEVLRRGVTTPLTASLEQDDVAASRLVPADRPHGDDLASLDRRLHADASLGEPFGSAGRRGIAAPAGPGDNNDQEQRQQPRHSAAWDLERLALGHSNTLSIACATLRREPLSTTTIVAAGRIAPPGKQVDRGRHGSRCRLGVPPWLASVWLASVATRSPRRVRRWRRRLPQR